MKVRKFYVILTVVQISRELKGRYILARFKTAREVMYIAGTGKWWKNIITSPCKQYGGKNVNLVHINYIAVLARCRFKKGDV
jgi:hypothetical protein